MATNPCLTCGACCAYYRASFYWREADDQTPGGVPLELTVDLTTVYRAMRDVGRETYRCVALQGEVGCEVSCAVYERRSSPCRDFPASYQNGEPNERCDKARLAYGLAPLRPEDWIDPGSSFRPAA